jgi:tetratricopeptide (TPR) repeat protein
MSEFTSTRSSSIPTIESKLNKAEQYKLEGNEHFKNQKFKKAISSYGKVLAYTKGLPGSTRGLSGVSEMASQSCRETSITEEEESRSILIETTVQTNLSVCYLKLDNGIKSLEHSKKALELNPKSWKGIYIYIYISLTSISFTNIDISM